jgi:hypothetical protein
MGRVRPEDASSTHPFHVATVVADQIKGEKISVLLRDASLDIRIFVVIIGRSCYRGFGKWSDDMYGVLLPVMCFPK